MDLLHSWAVDLSNRLCKSKYNCKVRVAPHFPSWICSLSRLRFVFLALGDYQACSRLARSTIPVASHAGAFRGARFSSLSPFVGRDEKRAPLKTPAWEATIPEENEGLFVV